MTSARMACTAELVLEAADYIAGAERATADYLVRAAWMLQCIAEEEAAYELKVLGQTPLPGLGS